MIKNGMFGFGDAFDAFVVYDNEYDDYSDEVENEDDDEDFSSDPYED